MNWRPLICSDFGDTSRRIRRVSVTVDSDADENDLARKRAAVLRSKLFRLLHGSGRMLHGKYFAVGDLWRGSAALLCLFGGNNSNVDRAASTRETFFSASRGAVAS